ncbi:carbohydrate ABC transporter permease [Rugosimonospora africana]|uniref:Sugar ABC transporter permease n=1 Tax=Rugosimonospora africana TaxID=556532 RepID=A0A8J3QP17_9ACTN|nr:carbohydrate ABC transporter permease [Rugosimonospora africana]GIH14384.1 sugar ABC transporter permease [Rugosimonospora africana]
MGAPTLRVSQHRSRPGTPPARPPRRRRNTADPHVGRSRTGSLVANAAGLLFAVVMAFPVYWAINTAFKPVNEVETFTPEFVPRHPTLSNFASALNAPNFLTDLKNSVIVTVCAVVFGLIIGFLGALAIARFRFYGRRALILVILIVQMIPFLSLLIPLYLTMNGLNLTNSLTGVVIVYMVLVLPYTVWMLRGFIIGVPRELDEAALVDGCTRWQTFYRIILPLTAPGLVAASIYGFIQTWNEFIIINTLNDSGKWNLMAWLASNQTLRGTTWGPLMAAATLTSLPVVVFFLIIQRNVATGLTAGAVKG